MLRHEQPLARTRHEVQRQREPSALLANGRRSGRMLAFGCRCGRSAQRLEGTFCHVAIGRRCGRSAQRLEGTYCHIAPSPSIEHAARHAAAEEAPVERRVARDHRARPAFSPGAPSVCRAHVGDGPVLGRAQLLTLRMQL